MPSLPVVFSERFRKSYQDLPQSFVVSCDRAVQALANQRPTPGMRAKPILPDKHYFEARISSGHRLIFRIEEGLLHLVDVVTHDDIARYSRRPTKPR
jgi:mRNA-degrading endonuclease RelE of RelBE toxin-antitoxin system